MDGLLQQVVVYSFISVLMRVAGAVVAAYRPATPAVQGVVQHFAAGELLPDIRQRHAPVEVVIGFALGVAVMLLIRQAPVLH